MSQLPPRDQLLSLQVSHHCKIFHVHMICMFPCFRIPGKAAWKCMEKKHPSMPLTPSVSETEDLAEKVVRGEKDIEFFQRLKLKGFMLETNAKLQNFFSQAPSVIRCDKCSTVRNYTIASQRTCLRKRCTFKTQLLFPIPNSGHPRIQIAVRIRTQTCKV